MAAVGRPAAGGPVVLVRVDDRTAGWCDGIFSGDRDMLAAAHRAIRLGDTAPLNGWDAEVPAAQDTALGAAAALITYNPGRAVVMRAPQNVLAVIAGNPDGKTPDGGLVF